MRRASFGEPVLGGSDFPLQILALQPLRLVPAFTDEWAVSALVHGDLLVGGIAIGHRTARARHWAMHRIQGVSVKTLR